VPEESLVIICPNPKCQKEVEEPILLTIFSVTPPKRYEACPYCFAKLEQKTPLEKEEITEPSAGNIPQEEPMPEKEDENAEETSPVPEKVKDSRPKFFDRVKSLIPNSSNRKKDKERINEPKVEPEHRKEQEPNKKQKADTSKQEEQKHMRSTSKDTTPGCPESFGYLANRQKDEQIPQSCLVCPRMVDCMLCPRDNP
jgi:hypothetical protein